MLLSWYQGKTGESYLNLECCSGDKPAWIVYAESRGGDLTIDINDGQYVFIYLSISSARTRIEKSKIVSYMSN